MEDTREGLSGDRLYGLPRNGAGADPVAAICTTISRQPARMRGIVMETIDCPRCERKPDMCNCTYDQLYASIYQMRAQLAAAKEEIERRKLKWQTGKPPRKGTYFVGRITPRPKYLDPIWWDQGDMTGFDWAGPIEPPEES